MYWLTHLWCTLCRMVLSVSTQALRPEQHSLPGSVSLLCWESFIAQISSRQCSSGDEQKSIVANKWHFSTRQYSLDWQINYDHALLQQAVPYSYLAQAPYKPSKTYICLSLFALDSMTIFLKFMKEPEINNLVVEYDRTSLLIHHCWVSNMSQDIQVELEMTQTKSQLFLNPFDQYLLLAQSMAE